jgi:hypothetical protein
MAQREIMKKIQTYRDERMNTCTTCYKYAFTLISYCTKNIMEHQLIINNRFTHLICSSAM